MPHISLGYITEHTPKSPTQFGKITTRLLIAVTWVVSRLFGGFIIICQASCSLVTHQAAIRNHPAWITLIGGINCHTIASYGSPNTIFQITSASFNQGNSRRHTDSLVSACFHCNLAKTPPHRAATHSHQPAIDLRSHHVFLPLVTRTSITAGGYLGLIASPRKVHRSVSRASRKPPHGRAQSQIT